MSPETTNAKRVDVYHDESDSDEPWRWRALGGNGDEIASGDGHTRPEDAARAARDLLGKDVPIFTTRPDDEAVSEEMSDGSA